MTTASKATLKSYFETNDTPTESQFSDLIDATYNGTVSVSSVDDFPSAVVGVITLADNTVYQINGTIDIGSNRLVMGADTFIKGNSRDIDVITSTTTDALITSTNSFRIWTLGFVCNSGTLLDLNGAGVEDFYSFGLAFESTGGLGDIASFRNVTLFNANFSTFTNGITLTGTNINLVIAFSGFSETTSATNHIDLGTATFDYVNFNSNAFTVSSGNYAFEIAADAANINAGGQMVISTNSIFGAGSGITGYTSLESAISCSLNKGIIDSDRLQPSGWGFYDDSETSPSTQTFTIAASKLQIDGGGATSSSDYLPLYLRSTSGELWDTTNDKIIPISIGDGYQIRLSFILTGKSGNPNKVTTQFDIGGGASPTVVIATRSATLSGVYPETVNMSFNIFSLSTFLTNGCQIFISTDAGTVTCSNRDILIQRLSSGAI